MSEARFAEITKKLDLLVAGQDRLRAGQDELRAGQEDLRAELRSGLDELRAGQSALRDDVEGLKTGQAELRRDVGELKTGQAELQRDVAESRVHLIRVDTRLDKLEAGQELLFDQVKQIAEGHAITQAAIARSTQELWAHLDRRIDPLERVVRAYFSGR